MVHSNKTSRRRDSDTHGKERSLTHSPDQTIDGPMHYQPDRELAESLSASVRICARDETDRVDLLEMLLRRPRLKPVRKSKPKTPSEPAC